MIVSTKDGNRKIPSSFAIAQNFPNPFNPSTTILFDVPIDNDVTIEVFDLLGRRVAAVVNEFVFAGEHSVMFDASRLSSGIYFYSMRAGSFTAVKKMSFIK